MLLKSYPTNGQTPDKSENLSSSMIKPSYCFLAISMCLRRDENEEMQKIANEIYNYIRENYKDVNIEFFDYKKDNYKADMGYFEYSHPFMRTTPFDKDILMEALQKTIKRKEFQKKKTIFLGGAFAMAKEGWFGTGAEKIEQKEFLEWIKEIKSIKQGAFSKHIGNCKKNSKFPNWHTSLKTASQIIKFQKELLNEYWTIAMEKESPGEHED